MALIGWWPLDGNTEDYTINQNHGVNTGVTWVNGKIGQAGNFVNGSTTRIVVPNNANLNPGTSSFSIALWIFISGPTTNFRGILDKGYSTAYGVFDVTNTAGLVGLYIQSGSNHNGIDFSDSYGKWTHCTWVVDRESGVQRSYKNGIFHTQTSFTLNNVTSANDLNFGTYTSGLTSSSFNGNVNDIRIYNHALSQKEINDLAKAKILHYTFNKDEDIIYDSSGYKHNAIISDSPSFEYDSKIGSRSIKLNPGKVIINPDPFLDSILSSGFTISLWTKGNINAEDFSYILHKKVPTNSSISGSVLYIGTTNSGYFSFAVNGGWVSGTTDVIQNPDLWYHLVLRYDGSVLTGFINGIQKVSYAGSISATIIDSYTVLGDSSVPYPNRRYNGLISDFEVYSDVLSNDEITELYQTRIKIDNQGNLYTNEIVEDYEIASGLTLRELFEDKNDIFNINFNSSTRVQSYTISPDKNHIILSNTDSGTWYTINNASFPLTSGDLIYSAITAKSNSTVNPKIQFQISTPNPNQDILNKVLNSNFNIYSNLATITNDTNELKIHGGKGTNEVSITTTFRDHVIINLTKHNMTFSKSELDAWYKDYITSRPKSSGIVKTREFSEVGIDAIAYEDKTYRDIFETNNMIDFSNEYSLFTSPTNSILTRTNDYIRVDIGTANDHRIIYNVDRTITANDVVYYRMTHETNGTTDSFYIYFPGIGASYDFIPMSSYRNSTFSYLYTHSRSGTGKYNFGRAVITNIPTQGDYTKLSNGIYAINLTTTFNTIPTQAQMDAMYQKYRQLKIADQKLRILKDMVVIDGSIQEG